MVESGLGEMANDVISKVDGSQREEKVHLKRNVGLVSGVSMIVGIMIGSGIFISPRGVLRGTGSVGLSFIVWAGCGVLSLLGSFCYAELGTTITKSGGEYAYLLEAFGPIPAFLVSWLSVTVSRGSSLAIVSLTCAEYVAAPFFGDCGSPETVKKVIAISVLVTICLVNCYSVRLAARVQVIFTAAKLIGLVIIIVGGIVTMSGGNIQHLSDGFQDTISSPSAIALAFYSGLWSYEGWASLNNVTEEIINPYKNLPRAILIAVPLVTAFYLLTNMSYMSVLSREEILSPNPVAMMWGDKVLGSASALMPVAVALSTFGSANGNFFTSGRVFNVAAREGHLPEVLSFIHVNKYTPFTALALTLVLSIIMVIPNDIPELVGYFSFTTWLINGSVMLGLITMRLRRKDMHRPFKVPLVIPIIMFVASVFLVLTPIVDNPQIGFFYVIVFTVSGLFLYFPLVHYRLRPRCFDSLDTFIQLLFQVAPSNMNPAEEDGSKK